MKSSFFKIFFFLLYYLNYFCLLIINKFFSIKSWNSCLLLAWIYACFILFMLILGKRVLDSSINNYTNFSIYFLKNKKSIINPLISIWLGKYLKQDVSVMAMVLSIVRLATRKQENVRANLNFLVWIVINAMKATTIFLLAHRVSVTDLLGTAMIMVYALIVKKDWLEIIAKRNIYYFNMNFMFILHRNEKNQN